MNPTEMVSKLWAIMWFSIVIKVFALNKELVYPSKQKKSAVALEKHGLPEKTQVSVYLTWGYVYNKKPVKHRKLCEWLLKVETE